MIKKMMALLVAISCAIGAWADVSGHISGTDFSPRKPGSFDTSLDDNGEDTGTNYWFTGDTSFVGTIVTNALEEKFLDFESDITNPLYRTINNCNGLSPSQFTAMPIGTGLFIDTYVQFTPYLVNENHPAPSAVTDDDKLIVWVREIEVENDANLTNLIVTAGYYNNFDEVSESNYVVTNLSPAEIATLCSTTNRLTIKSFSSITGGDDAPAGFVVYINKKSLEYAADAFSGGSYVGNLDTTPAAYYEPGRHRLFPSLMAGDQTNHDKLSGVGYAGMGKIGEVWFDDYSTDYPDFAGDDHNITIVKGEGVVSYVYNNITYTEDYSTAVSVPTVTISNVVYNTSAGYQHKTGTWYIGSQVVNNTSTADGDIGTFDLANGNRLVLAGFKANYLVGGTEYQSLFGIEPTETTGAYNAAKNGGTIKLNKDILIDEGTHKQIVVGEDDDLTIDLNGHTLRGTSAEVDEPSIVNNLGTLTIIDTSVGQTGKVLGCLSYDSENDEWINNYKAIKSTGEYVVSNALTAGTYELIITDVNADKFVISAGSYICPHDDEEHPEIHPAAFYLASYLAPGATVTSWTQDPVTEFWYAIVGGSAPTTYAVTFSTNSVPVAEYTTNITAGATLPDGAIPAFTGGAWDVDPTNAVINAATNFNYTIETSYTLTYVTEYGTVPDGVVYTASTPDFALAAAPTADGWQFGGWLIGETVCAAEDTYVVAEHLENTTATAVWTPVAYTLTYATDHGTAPDAVSYTVESNNFALAAAPVTSEVGIEFVGWVIGVTTNNAGATYVVADHLANTTATAAWAALVPPAKFPQSDTAGTEYAGRTGTPASPFVIRNYDDLVLLKNAVADGEITTESFEVVSNITGVTDWVGIGTSSSVAFAGTLNGNGKTIDIAFAAGKYNGLFCYINNATISNLTVNVTGVTVSDKTGGAAFVGYAYGVNVLTAIKATGSLGTDANRVTHNAGGLVTYAVGPSASITYNNCTNAMDVYSTYTKLGGFLGWASGGASITINNGVNLGNLSSTNTKTSENNGVGGFIGWDGTGTTVTINGAISLGTVANGSGFQGSFYGDRNSPVPTLTGVIQALDNQRLMGCNDVTPTPDYAVTYFNWATVDGNVVTFVTPTTLVGDTVTYKAMQPVSTAFTLTADDASLTIITNFCAYTGTVSVDASLTAQGYERVETADANGVTFTCAIPGPTDPWAPDYQTDESASNKVVSIFGAGSDVANHVTTLAEYGNLVAYITNVTSEAMTPAGLSNAQKAWMWKSYILGANPLFDADVAVEITSLTANSEAGKWDFTVKVTEGESTDAYNVAADKVAALVKIRTSLTTGTWVTPTAGNIEAIKLLGGNLIKVTVNFGDGASGFMKVAE